MVVLSRAPPGLALDHRQQLGHLHRVARRACRRGRLSPAPRLAGPRPAAAPEPSPFSQHTLNHLIFQAHVGHQLLEPAAFLLYVLEALQFDDLQAAVLALSLVKRGFAQAVLAANAGHGLALALLAQGADDLRFTKAALFFMGLWGRNGKIYPFPLLFTGLLWREDHTETPLRKFRGV